MDSQALQHQNPLVKKPVNWPAFLNLTLTQVFITLIWGQVLNLKKVHKAAYTPNPMMKGNTIQRSCHKNSAA